MQSNIIHKYYVYLSIYVLFAVGYFVVLDNLEKTFVEIPSIDLNIRFEDTSA